MLRKNKDKPPSDVESFTPIEKIFDMPYLEQYVVQVLDYTSKYNSRMSRFYAPENLIGKYEVYPSYGDSISTYALRHYGNWWKKSEAYQKNYRPQDTDPLSAEDYVTVLFRNAVVPRHIYIYETYNPGAVVRIWGRLTEHPWTLLWEGPPQKCAAEVRKFAPKIKETNCLIDQLRLELNQSHLKCYTALDAILLGGAQPKSILQHNLLMNVDNWFLKTDEPKTDCEDSMDDELKDNIDIFMRLPYEVIVHIFQYLDLKSLIRCSQVNKRFNEAALDSSLYQNLNLKRYWNKVNCDTLEYFMDRCKGLKKLDISWCTSEDQRMPELLIKFLHECSGTLTHLSLNHCDFITEEVIQEIGKHCTELTELRLRSCQLGDLWNFLWLANLNKLVTLDLYYCDIRTSVLMNILKSNPNLKHIILDFCEELTMDSVVDLATQCNKNLVSWSSWKTKSLTADGVACFARCPNLRELDLGWCLMLADPGESLNTVAQTCRNLRKLIISGWRGVDDQTLMRVVMSCTQLTHLELVGIPGFTGDVIHLALRLLPNLQLLDLSFCDVSEQEVMFWSHMFHRVTIQKEVVSEEYWS